ncbi:Hypothetical predicted protein [Cloeon dipterum]|uniref:Uncharacterized protein n=1 Tax=Cloeon dipterum TaxID=197152 RepID=A0A8S1DC29_9INSE|nr:Hypothetical predicted protein [Cloeon dipterum]
MGKAQFYERLLFILIITTAAFLVSGIAPAEKDDEIKEKLWDYETDKYFSMYMQYVNNSNSVVSFFWKDMTDEEDVIMLTNDQFDNEMVLIELPFEIQLFGTHFTRIVLTTQGTIKSADPSVDWTIAPLNAKFGMSRTNILYLLKKHFLYVQWYGFQFKNKKFEHHSFSFQVRLSASGEIDFVYKRVPMNLLYLRKKCIYCLEEKYGVMYRHHEVFEVPPYNEAYELGFSMDFEKYPIRHGIEVSFFPADSPKEAVRCAWCPAIEKCSSTRDSLQHVWKENKCDANHIYDQNSCFFHSKGFKREKVVKICYTIPSEWLRERIQSRNQPNQAQGNNQAGDQNNDQQDGDINTSQNAETEL